MCSGNDGSPPRIHPFRRGGTGSSPPGKNCQLFPPRKGCHLVTQEAQRRRLVGSGTVCYNENGVLSAAGDFRGGGHMQDLAKLFRNRSTFETSQGPVSYYSLPRLEEEGFQ